MPNVQQLWVFEVKNLIGWLVLGKLTFISIFDIYNFGKNADNCIKKIRTFNKTGSLFQCEEPTINKKLSINKKIIQVIFEQLLLGFIKMSSKN